MATGAGYFAGEACEPEDEGDECRDDDEDDDERQCVEPVHGNLSLRMSGWEWRVALPLAACGGPGQNPGYPMAADVTNSCRLPV